MGPVACSVGSSEKDVAGIVKVIAILVLITPTDGFYTLSYAVGISPTTVIGYLVFILAVTRIPSIIRCQPAAFWLWVVVYVIGTAIALTYYIVSSDGLDPELTTIWQMVAFWALVNYCSSSKNGGELAINHFLVGSTLTLAAYIFLYTIGFDTSVQADRVFKVAGYQSNQIGFLTAGVFLMIAENFSRQSRTKALFGITGLVLCLYVLWLSNSKGAFLAMSAGSLTFLIPFGKHAKFTKTRLAVVMVGGLLILVLSLDSSRNSVVTSRVLQRWSSAENIDDLTSDRSEILRLGLGISTQYPLGVGMGNSKALLGVQYKKSVLRDDNQRIVDAHNQYLNVLLESGYVGLAVFLVGCGVLLAGVVRLRTRYRLAWPLALLICILTGFMNGTLAYYKATWIMLGLITGHIIQVRNNGPLRR